MGSKFAHPPFPRRTHPWHLTLSPCPGRREFDRSQLPGVGHLTAIPEVWGVWLVPCFSDAVCGSRLQIFKQLPYPSVINGEPTLIMWQTSRFFFWHLKKKNAGNDFSFKIITGGGDDFDLTVLQVISSCLPVLVTQESGIGCALRKNYHGDSRVLDCDDSGT